MLNKQRFIEFIDQIITAEADKLNIVRYIQPIETLVVEKISALMASINDYYYWNKPSSKTSFLAFGNKVSIQNNFHHSSLNMISNIDATNFEGLPVVIGGTKFPSSKSSRVWEDFNQNEWFIPQVIYYNHANESYIVIHINAYELPKRKEKILQEVEKIISELTADSDNSNNDYNIRITDCSTYENWNEIVAKSLLKIKINKLSKVVLARCAVANVTPKPRISNLLCKLIDEFPNCYIFAYKKANSIFFGATPEQLMMINKEIIETEALAGTMSRGKTETEDELLADELLNNRKELAEHKSVLDFLISTLSEISENIEFDITPKIKKLHFMQHLWSKISARLKTDESIFSVIEKLYPTPAICGLPKEEALKTIEECEDFERGMYAGLLGWFNNNGQGEFAVAIRSALIKDCTMYTYAGCGIVEGSDSELEFKETELKFKPIISLFENETINQS